MKIGLSVDINKVENGWRVDESWEEKDEKGEMDYKSKQWVYLTVEEALKKVEEIVKT